MPGAPGVIYLDHYMCFLVKVGCQVVPVPLFPWATWASVSCPPETYGKKLPGSLIPYLSFWGPWPACLAHVTFNISPTTHSVTVLSPNTSEAAVGSLLNHRASLY